MDLLILLVERNRQLGSRADIVKRLWDRGVLVDFEMGVNTAIRKLRQALKDSRESQAFVETISGKGYRFIAPVTTRAASTALQTSVQSESPVRLAVLPFENFSNDPEQEYISDRLTEETISYLGRMNPERMGVIARTSSMAYKDTSKSIREIGAELGVDYILESSVRREDKRVRITAQLIRVKDQTHVWASTYDRGVGSVLTIQRELSTAIAKHVGLQLLPERFSVLAHRQTRKVEAYNLYLRGRYFWNQLSAVTTKRAMEYYERATMLDPEYALAWSGVSDAYTASPINADRAPLRTWPSARDAVAHATASGPSLPEVQTSLGLFKFWLDWDWVAAEAAFRKSIALDPSYSLAHRFLGIVLSHLARHEEASLAIRHARDAATTRTRTATYSWRCAAWRRAWARFRVSIRLTLLIMHCQRRLRSRPATIPSAVQFAKQAITIDPEFWIGYLQLAQVYEQLGNTDLAPHCTQQCRALQR